MSYRNDLDALAARAAALDHQVAAAERERDAAKQLLDEARGQLEPTVQVRRRRSAIGWACVGGLGALVCVAAWGVSRDWPLGKHPDPPHVVARTSVIVDQPVTQPIEPSGLPPECDAYASAIERLQSCDKMPGQARSALAQALAQASAGWRNLPPEAKPALATACKAGTDAIEQSAGTTCGW